jgi:SHAQKYF class myb-like DNA-binding protein
VRRSALVASHIAVSSQTDVQPVVCKNIGMKKRPWTSEEEDKFKDAERLYGHNWRACAKYIGTRTNIQVRSHAQKYLLKKKPLEDKKQKAKKSVAIQCNLETWDEYAGLAQNKK